MEHDKEHQEDPDRKVISVFRGKRKGQMPGSDRKDQGGLPGGDSKGTGP